MLSVMHAEGDARRESFDQFRQFAAGHEAVEQEFIHEPAHGKLDENRGMADARAAEEDEIAAAIRHLETLDVASGEFAAMFERLAKLIDGHLDAEEHQELPVYSHVADDDEVIAALEALDKVFDFSENGIGDSSYEDFLELACESLRRAPRE